MAEIGRLSRARGAAPWLTPVTLVRVVIVLFVLVVWQVMAVSGWFYRDVVPSLRIVAVALVKLISSGDFYWNLWATLQEVAIGLVIGGISGIVAGLVVGANRFLAKAFEPYLYYLGPTPKIIFFPIMIMWFGVGSGSKIAMGAVSCFFPIALNVAAGMRQIDQVLIRVGQSFRANPWQMAMKIYLPAMRHPIINGAAARPRRRADRHAARRDQALQPRHRLHGDRRLHHVRHAAHVRHPDRAVRAGDRRQHAGGAVRRPRRHQAKVMTMLHPQVSRGGRHSFTSPQRGEVERAKRARVRGFGPHGQFSQRPNPLTPTLSPPGRGSFACGKL